MTNIDNNAPFASLYGPDYTFVYDEGTGGAPPCPTGNLTACAYRRGCLARVTLEYATAQFWTMTYDYTPAGEVNFEGHADGRFTRFERDATGRLELYLHGDVDDERVFWCELNCGLGGPPVEA